MSWHVVSLSLGTVFTFQMLSQLIAILAVSSHVALVNDCCHLFLASGCLFFLELQAIHEHLALLEALKLETLPSHGVELAKIMEFILVKTHYSNSSISASAPMLFITSGSVLRPGTYGQNSILGYKSNSS